MSSALSFGACSDSPGLRVEEGKFLLHGRPYRGVGVNYYDLFLRLMADPRQKSSLDGLGCLAKSGIPFVRFNGGGYAPEHWRVYQNQKDHYFAQFDRVVRTAEAAGIGLIPCLFWQANLQKVVGEHKEAWGDPSSRTMRLMRQYVSDVVSRYKDSPAIWAWEFGNEWNLSADLPNAKEFRSVGEDARDDLKWNQMAVAIQEFAQAVRAIDPYRPLMTGHSHPRASAWHNTAENNWKPDSFLQWREVILRDNPEAVNTIGIHIYGDSEAREACGQWTDGWPDYLGRLRQLADEQKLPVYIGEFGLAETRTRQEGQVRQRFLEILSAMETVGVDLAAVWVYDLPAQNGSWNIDFGNARSYMLDQVIAANNRWNQLPPSQ